MNLRFAVPAVKRAAERVYPDPLLQLLGILLGWLRY
jgi:hypothetical protein